MPTKKSREQFISEAIKIHGDKYDYSFVNYINNKTKIKILCKIHDRIFEQAPQDHLQGQGCPKCGKEITKEKLKNNGFIKQAKLKFGNKYDYSFVDYINNNTKIKIICKECEKELNISPKDFLRRGHKCIFKKNVKLDKAIKQNLFKLNLETKYLDKFQYDEKDYKTNKDKMYFFCNDCGNMVSIRPDTLLANHTVNGCKWCELILKRKRNSETRKTKEQFIEDAIKIHGNEYNYSKIKYVNNKIPIEIFHNKCGKIFWQSPLKHLQGSGCLKCCGRDRTTEEAIEDLKSIFGDKYDYSKVEYINATKELTLICKKHDIIVKASYHDLMSVPNRKCCYKEWQSKPNLHIKDWLDNNGIKNLPEHTFDNCKYKDLLSFDFYLPEYKTVIEYQGEWHYFDFKGQLETQQKRDKIKREWCVKNQITEIEIPYWEFENIDKILIEKLKIAS